MPCLDWKSLYTRKQDAQFIDEFYQDLFATIERKAGLGVFVEGTVDRSFVETQLQAGDPSLPLYPLPFGVKDIINVEGLPTRCGSRLPESCFLGNEAAVVARLRELGAVVIGKTVTTEFAGRVPGPTKNPHNEQHTPGGSSSGSAAGVAAGLFPLALGTQTSGSVIRPASYCGVYGFKPSFGKLPIAGVFPLAPSLDHVGVLSVNFEFLTLFAKAYWGMRTRDATHKGQLTFGIPVGNYFTKADNDTRHSFKDTVSKLEQAGHAVIEIECLSDIDLINERHYTLVREEAVSVHHSLYKDYHEFYSAEFGDVIAKGSTHSLEELSKIRAQGKSLRSDLHKLMDLHNVDYWLTPSTTGTAPEGLSHTGSAIMNLVWTHVGMPALTIPAGTVKGLPLGLQFVGRFDEDFAMLSDLALL